MRAPIQSGQPAAAQPSLNNSAKPRARHGIRAAAAVLLLGGLAACQTTGNSSSSEGIGYRAARAEQVMAMQDYRACVEEAVSLDRQARESASSAQYLASARIIERCEASLGPEAGDLNDAERMRAYALGTLNALKGGDPARATAMLQRFETAFDGRDLYFQDGTSFTETMGALLGREEGVRFGHLSTLNVNRALKDEMRRVDHWSKS